MVSAHYSTFPPKSESRMRGRTGVLLACIALVALVGVASFIPDEAPEELEQQMLKGPWRLVNKCNLYGCHTVRVQVDEKTQLEATHEERLRALKSAQNAIMEKQRHAMEASLQSYVGTRMHTQQELAMAKAPASTSAAAAITKAFAKVDSENPKQAPALAAAAKEKAAAVKVAKAGKVSMATTAHKPSDTLQAEAKKAIDDSAAVQQTVQQEVVAIRAQAVAAERKIQTQEREEVKAIQASVKQAHVASVTTPAAATTKKAALPQQAGPKAAKFAMPASTGSPEEEGTQRAAPVIASAASTSKKVALPVQDGPKAAKFNTVKSTDPKVVEKKVEVKKAAAAKHADKVRTSKKAHKVNAPSNDVAARRPQMYDMKDGDQKPRGAVPAAVQGGYWKQSLAHSMVKSGRKQSGGQKVHKSLVMQATGVKKLIQMPAKKGKAYSSRRVQGRAAMRAENTNLAPDFSDKRVAAAKAATPFDEFAGQVLANKKSAIKGHVLHLPGWFSSQMEKAMGISSGDHQAKGDSPQAQKTLWSSFASGQKLAGGVQVRGQQLAAQKKAVDSGKLKLQGVDRPAIQTGMGDGGFVDTKVKANAVPEPLWDVFKAKGPAKSGKL